MLYVSTIEFQLKSNFIIIILNLVDIWIVDVHYHNNQFEIGVLTNEDNWLFQLMAQIPNANNGYKNETECIFNKTNGNKCN